MNERLKEMVKQYGSRAGRSWRAKLSVASGLSLSTIQKIESGDPDHVFYAETIKLLALACGKSTEEAEALMGAYSSGAKKRTA